MTTNTHPYTVAYNRDYTFTLATNTVSGTYQGTNDLGFWIIRTYTGPVAINPDLVHSFRGAQ